MLLRYCSICVIAVMLVGAASAGWAQEGPLKQGRAKLNAGDFAGAIDVLKKALKDYPNTAEVHYWLGVAYFRNKQTDEALGSALKAFELKPKYMLNRGLMADLFLEMEKYAEAQAECEVILKESKKDFDTRLKLAKSCIGQKKFKEAAEILAKLEFEQPQNVQVLLLSGKSYAKQRVNEEAIKYYSKALQIDPNSIETKLELGKLYFRDQKYNEALNTYLDVVRLDSNNPDANLQAGYIFFEAGKGDHYDQYGKAIGFLLRYIRLQPNDYKGHILIGKSYHALRQYRNAVPYLEKAAELDTSKTRDEGLKLLAESYVRTGNFEKAAAAYEDLLKRNFEMDSKDYVLLGASCKALKDTVNTVKYYTKAVSLDSFQYERYYDIGVMFAAAKKYSEAVSWFEKRLAISAADSNAATSLQQLGSCQFNSAKSRHDSVNALVALRKATALRPASAAAWQTLGQISERLDSVAVAKDAYERVLGIDSVNAVALFGLGTIAYNKEKKYNDAVSYLRKMVKDAKFESAISYVQKAAKDENLKNDKISYDGAVEYVQKKDERFKIAHYMIAQCFVKLNKNRDAMEILKKYLAMDPNGPNAKFAKAQLLKLQQ